MINYITGKVVEKASDFLVLENRGIGYKIFCSSQTSEKIREGEAKIFTFLHSKEDTQELYGFLSKEELGLFEVLYSISGVGPRTALDLSVFGSLANLKKEIEKGGLEKKIKGVGKKRIQKILLELTGKIKEERAAPSAGDEVLETLVSLGFSGQKAREALSRIPKDLKSQEERLKEALKIMGK